MVQGLSIRRMAFTAAAVSAVAIIAIANVPASATSGLKPGKLDAQEREEIEQHTLIGQRMLERIPFFAGVHPLVRSAHEHWDGRGYPDRLAGEDIPLGARIICACDAFHAMISDRPYRAAMPIDEALAELRHGAGSQFDPQVVRALDRVLA